MTAPLSPEAPHVKRGCLLTAAPALCFTGVVGSGAVPAMASPAQTPAAAMHREITWAQELLNQPHNGLTDAEADALCDRMIELANDIAYLPSAGPMDVLLKIAGHTVNGDHELRGVAAGERIWSELVGVVAASA